MQAPQFLEHHKKVHFRFPELLSRADFHPGSLLPSPSRASPCFGKGVPRGFPGPAPASGKGPPEAFPDQALLRERGPPMLSRNSPCLGKGASRGFHGPALSEVGNQKTQIKGSDIKESEIGKPENREAKSNRRLSIHGDYRLFVVTIIDYTFHFYISIY